MITKFLGWSIGKYRKTILKLKTKYYRSVGTFIGENTYIAPNVYLDVSHKPGKIKIGSNCNITRNVVVLSHTDTRLGGPRKIWEEYGGERTFGETIIGDNVFIGVNSVIMPGAKIGDNSIIGALSFVRGEIPEGSIAVGNPAKVIGKTMDHVKGQKKK